jgi:hypothetical protein
MEQYKNIGKKVRITGYPNYNGQIGTVVEEDYDAATLITVEMPDGELLYPYIRGNGKRCSEGNAQAEWVEETYIGRRVKLDTKYYSKGSIGTVIREDLRNHKILWTVELEEGGTREPWAATNTDPNYRQCELLPEETTNTNNQNQSTMSTRSNTQAPAMFYITSEYPEIMKVFWEEMKKMGYKCTNTHDRDWKIIGQNSGKGTAEEYMDIYISCNAHHPDKIYDKEYTLPQQWEAALKHITDAAKYWEEQEKKPVYQKGDWVTVVNDVHAYAPKGHTAKVVKVDGQGSIGVEPCVGQIQTGYIDGRHLRPATPQEIQEASRYKIGEWVYLKSHRPGSHYTSPIGTVKQIDSVCGDGIWLDGGGKWYNEDIRRATTEEITAAQTVYVNIGTRQLSVAISSGKIIAEGRTVDISDVRAIASNMETPRKVGPWTAVYTTCNVGCVTGVTLAELQEIVKAYEKLTKN